MFALVNYARFIGVNPEDALEKTNMKFIRRFQYLEKHRIVAKDIVIPKLERAMVVGAYGRYYLQAGEFQKALDQYLKAFRMVNPDSVEQRAFIAQLCNSNGNVYLKLGKPKDLRLGNSMAIAVDTGLIKKRQTIIRFKRLRGNVCFPIIIILRYIDSFHRLKGNNIRTFGKIPA